MSRPFALQNIFEANYDIEDENVALIDIGASKTSLNILTRAIPPCSCRCGPGLPFKSTRRSLSLLDCSYDQAELLKIRRDLRQDVRGGAQPDHHLGG